MNVAEGLIFQKYLRQKYTDLCVGPEIIITHRIIQFDYAAANEFYTQHKMYRVQLIDRGYQVPDLLHCFGHFSSERIYVVPTKNNSEINQALVGSDPRLWIPKDPVPRWIMCSITILIESIIDINYDPDQNHFDYIANKSGHANLLLLDTVNQTAERFEPHGNGFLSAASKIDEYIKFYLSKIPGYQFKYFSPLDPGCLWFGPQSIENFFQPEFMWKDGFCAYWSLYYLESRILNPDVERFTLLDQLLKKSPQELYELIVEYAIEVDSIIQVIQDAQKVLEPYNRRKALRDFNLQNFNFGK